MMSTILLKMKKMKMIDLGLKISHSCKKGHIVQLSLMKMDLINRRRAQPSETLNKKSSHAIKMKMMIPQHRMKS
jgi:hypothetical protein